MIEEDKTLLVMHHDAMAMGFRCECIAPYLEGPRRDELLEAAEQIKLIGIQLKQLAQWT